MRNVVRFTKVGSNILYQHEISLYMKSKIVYYTIAVKKDNSMMSHCVFYCV